MYGLFVGDRPPSGGVLTPDGRNVVYAADQQEDDKYEVFLSAVANPSIEDVSPLPNGQPVHH